MKVEIRNLSKAIESSQVLCDIQLVLESGRVYGLQGVNGSGKTMLMRAICGLIHPTAGAVLFDGRQLGKELSFAPGVGALLEGPSFLPGLTGFRNLKLLADIQGKVTEDSIRDVLQTVGLNPWEKKKYRKYSLGMKQRLGIAAAILEQPELLILDEPFNALDTGGVEMVRQVVEQTKRRGAAVLLACHDAGQLEQLCDEIFCMEQGRIVRHLQLSSKGDGL